MGSLRYPQDRLKIVRNLTEEIGSICASTFREFSATKIKNANSGDCGLNERAETLTYLVPQPQPAISKADVDVRAGATGSFRSRQRRWPMALSIWAAVAVSLAMWAGIAWVVSRVLGLFT